MKVLITGGAGFLGQRLARQLLVRGQLSDSQGRTQNIDQIVLVDVVPAYDFNDARVRVVMGDSALTLDMGGASAAIGVSHGGMMLRRTAAEARVEVPRRLKRAVTVAEQHRDAIRERVGDDEVETAVAVQITGRDGVWSRPDRIAPGERGVRRRQEEHERQSDEQRDAADTADHCGAPPHFASDRRAVGSTPFARRSDLENARKFVPLAAAASQRTTRGRVVARRAGCSSVA